MLLSLLITKFDSDSIKLDHSYDSLAEDRFGRRDPVDLLFCYFPISFAFAAAENAAQATRKPSSATLETIHSSCLIFACVLLAKLMSTHQLVKLLQIRLDLSH